MTIDEIIKHVLDMKKGIYLYYPEELYDSIIDLAHSYQKLQADYEKENKNEKNS